MAIILPPEAPRIRQIKWTLRQPHQVNRSQWTGRRQVLSVPGAARWSCSAVLVPIIGQDRAKKWRGFFNSLEGQLHKFPLAAVEAPQHGGANPTSATGTAGSKSLQLAGPVPALDAGDFLTVELDDGSQQLVVLSAPIAGTTATFAPTLRNAVTAKPVETILPFAHVSLVEDSFEHTVDAGQVYTFAFDAEESF